MISAENPPSFSKPYELYELEVQNLYPSNSPNKPYELKMNNVNKYELNSHYSHYSHFIHIGFSLLLNSNNVELRKFTLIHIHNKNKKWVLINEIE